MRHIINNFTMNQPWSSLHMKDLITNLDAVSVVTFLLYAVLAWKTVSNFYICQSLSNYVTPSSLGRPVRFTVTLFTFVSSTLIRMLPMRELPRLRLASTIMSMPTQFYSLYIANKFVDSTFKSTTCSVVLYIFSFLSILQTIYQIMVDWDRIDKEE